MADAPLLDLDTLVLRQTISIDGQSYPIFSPDELSVMQSHQFSVWGRRIEMLSKSDQAEDGAELEDMINQAARAAFVDVPAEVFDKLNGAHKMAIVDVFTALLLRRALGVAGAMATATGIEQIGATSFPGSSASTAASRAGGFMKRLLGWFGPSSR